MSTPDPAASEPPLATLTLTPFDVTRRLAAELAAGEVRLPSLADVAERRRRVLEDERATPARIGEILGADAALAARVLRIANAAVFNAAGKPVTDLPTAVSRLGFEPERRAPGRGARHGPAPRRRPPLSPGPRGRCRTSSPRRACGSGRARRHPRIGGAILGHWRFAERIVLVVADQNTWDRPSSGASLLTDVLIVATSLVPCVFYRQLLDDTVTAVAPFQRLGLATEDCNRLLAATAPHINGRRDELVA